MRRRRSARSRGISELTKSAGSYRRATRIRQAPLVQHVRVEYRALLCSTLPGVTCHPPPGAAGAAGRSWVEGGRPEGLEPSCGDRQAASRTHPCRTIRASVLSTGHSSVASADCHRTTGPEGRRSSSGEARELHCRRVRPIRDSRRPASTGRPRREASTRAGPRRPLEVPSVRQTGRFRARRVQGELAGRGDSCFDPRSMPRSTSRSIQTPAIPTGPATCGGGCGRGRDGRGAGATPPFRGGRSGPHRERASFVFGTRGLDHEAAAGPARRHRRPCQE